MKNIITLLLVLHGLLSEGQTMYQTSNTTNTNIGEWTKIARVSISYQYHNSNSIILLSGGNSSNLVACSKLFFRVKQQAAFPGEPYIQLELSKQIIRDSEKRISLQ